MQEIKKHLLIFPSRIKFALEKFDFWESATEIRLRKDLPLSVTCYDRNVFLDENGCVTNIRNAIKATERELTETVCSFCSGNLYRYFDTLQDGFLIDEDGFRLGVCPAKNSFSTHLPESFEGISLRIPRANACAADAFLDYFKQKTFASALIISPPGEGKTTLLRALAVRLSSGFLEKAYRVAVIDERKELFPPRFLSDAGMCDVLRGYDKEKGLEIASRIFSPEVMICDEIASPKDADAVITGAGSGSLIFASAHGGSFEEAERRPFLQKILQAKVFRYLVLLKRKQGKHFQSEISIKEII
ncbi:MAG: hypothetical protein IKT50_00600 [Clostridia bacterium]|nr:hypothetical protein [Clostridia bacterium]